ncbi:helix-turn-helix domain-containing protein [Bacillus thuringiensis]|uniref:helix-turn-helix domain-containing protein n=1 Tax=Bacillus thuringiensis TaxID=1428 RepID=UPI00345AC6A3
MTDMLSVSHTKDINLASGEVTSNMFVKVYNTIFTEGLVSKMGATGFTTLVALATFMNEKGECYPTQEQIAERIGVHKNTANKYLNALLEVRINDVPLVTRSKINKGKGKISSFYKIHPLAQLAKFNGEVTPVSDTNGSDESSTTMCDELITPNCDVIRINELESVNKINKLNSSSAIKLFQQFYYEVYGVNYVVGSYGREGKLIKDKLLTPHGDIAADIIEIAVKEYGTRWKSPKFPRPTIGMFTWVTNHVLEILEQQQKENEVVNNASELEAQAEADMLSKLEKLGAMQ